MHDILTMITIAMIFSLPAIGFSQNSENASQSVGAEVKTDYPCVAKDI